MEARPDLEGDCPVTARRRSLRRRCRHPTEVTLLSEGRSCSRDGCSVSRQVHPVRHLCMTGAPLCLPVKLTEKMNKILWSPYFHGSLMIETGDNQPSEKVLTPGY